MYIFTHMVDERLESNVIVNALRQRKLFKLYKQDYYTAI